MPKARLYLGCRRKNAQPGVGRAGATLPTSLPRPTALLVATYPRETDCARGGKEEFLHPIDITVLPPCVGCPAGFSVPCCNMEEGLTWKQG